MHLPLTERRRSGEPSDRSTAADEERSSSGPGLFRLLLLAVAVAGLVYLASRRAGSGDDFPGVDDVRETVEGVRPGRDDEGSSSSDDAESAAAVTEFDESADEMGSTAEEIVERSEEDIQEEPAEPGEMTVDEDIADELVGDEGTNGSGDASDADEDEE